MRRARTTAIAFVLAAGFYLLLIDTVELPELYAGAVVALLAAAIFEVSREHGLVEVEISPRRLAGAWRVAARIPAQVVLVSREAVVQLFARERARGAFRAVPFAAGGENRRDAGRRALVEALGSLTPNTIVVGVDAERNLLLVHQLHPQGGSEELDVMRLG
ncbi:MAG TPA: Na+/H+ antiporter subunit E [Solirubrobacteraceae bacterium]|nr:Na+/H+ antiporter subunit E [Solirubrobacteraceae bacterium]